jgi:uncharacterized protein (TIGR01732 family)
MRDSIDRHQPILQKKRHRGKPNPFNQHNVLGNNRKGGRNMSVFGGGLFDDEQFLIILVLFILLVIVGAGED